MKRILFVCTGNTCRSPMAEGLFKKLISKNNIQAEITSAGIFANDGVQVSDKAVVACAEKGVNICDHISKSISNGLLIETDLVLTMTRTHKQLLLQSFPNIKDKVYTLKEYNGKAQSKDIEDPFGQNLEAYRQCSDELLEELQCLMKLLW